MIKPILRDCVVIRPSVADSTMVFNLVQQLLSCDDYSGLNALIRDSYETEKNPFYSLLLLRASFTVRYYTAHWVVLFEKTERQLIELKQDVAREMKGLFLPVILPEVAIGE